MPPVLTGDSMRCSRLFGEVGHYAPVLRPVSNVLAESPSARLCRPWLARIERRRVQPILSFPSLRQGGNGDDPVLSSHTTGRKRMKPYLLASIAGLLLGASAHAAPSYAVLSLVGDKLDVVTYQMATGSKLDANSHNAL